VMPNMTPTKYRRMYEIYPGKACIEESSVDCSRCLRGQIHALGRFAGEGPGGRGSIQTQPANMGSPSILPVLPVQGVQLQT
jgi:hypothetical protein